MEQEKDSFKKLEKRILELKSHFSNYNIVRMREALRYLSGSSLSLFIKIPFLIHINTPEMPGYVEAGEPAHGIYKFERSGFYKEILSQNLMSEKEILQSRAEDPCVLGFYHIGSLGTFTQSAASDFDYWIIIDKKAFSETRYYNLEKKLNKIVKFARETHHQEVTFFIMDQADIQKNIYAGFKARETITAPKVFLKEEFYRTFLMIAGKIPFWALIPAGSDVQTYTHLIKSISSVPALENLSQGFIDLGMVESPGHQDILKGVLWHICKSREDPVKALIKASMIFSYRTETWGSNRLLCDEIKAGYAKAGIDDYRADPYRLLFDRIIKYHQKEDPGNLNLIKNAVFFRLCSYPDIKAPEPGSPKKALLDRYIREWNLNQTQVNKLLSYGKWAEPEKQLLEKTIISRLEQMVKLAKQSPGDEKSKETIPAGEKRNFLILSHRAAACLNHGPGKIAECSIYLRRQTFTLFILQQKKYRGWYLSGYLSGQPLPGKLHQDSSFLGVWGWILENQLYDRMRTSVKIDVPQKIFESHAEPVEPDRLYMALQPVKPLSEEVFEKKASWVKLLILLIYEENKEISILKRAEILALNSWGELFLEALTFDEAQKTAEERYRAVARKISPHMGDSPKLNFFQLASRHDPDAVYEIRKKMESGSFPGMGVADRKRPVLDKL
ncbi:class I adenylate cyclase [Desulfospira joergensenii]|uniref:class I adenylate cyclase n=1 Tax=Desulfospira joergensenii TaxID=53329 RepID=UPI0003B70481|nr:class I adenylate cyclase [Desulfospira joergensenii]